MRPLQGLVEEARARLERAGEALLLRLEQPPDVLAVLLRLRVGAGEGLDDDVLQAPQEGRLEPDPGAVLDGPPDDPPQDVAARLVGRDDTVGGQHDHGAAVVGQDSQGPLLRAPVGHAGARPGLQGADDEGEVVRLEHRRHVLEDGGHALEPTAGVDAGARERLQPALGVAVELHEHEVPELQVALARAAGPAVLAATAERLAAVDVELRARPAGPGGAGGPEVVLAQGDDALGRQAGLDPQPLGLLVEGHLVVALPDGRPEKVRVHAPGPRAELPGRLRWRTP